MEIAIFDQALAAKEAALIKYLQQYQRPALAFSGGVDSSVLLATCREAKVNVIPITALSEFTPLFEQNDAKNIAQETQTQLITIQLHPLDNPAIVANDSLRCYHCKKALMTALQAKANELGCDILLDGANLDDTSDYRPGMKAAKELGVVSPLLACGLTKAEVRALALKYGLSVAHKPAYACLASRIAYKEPLSAEKLKMVEQAEDYLRSLGFHEVRVRCHGSLARIEVNPKEIALIAAGLRQSILQKLQAIGFTYVTLDLQGYRTGSLNSEIKKN